ncbi:ribulokinase [Spiractinospora alimapuensis]|uniref:ribulokinase n=1 Tax=Spiractinospora alimapuensis TaxID=2820884 RepID=UPI001EEB4B6E|nr:ribulokinase [Spiractinospora alimapuensis]QVQ53585.1 ribulokinase [Spiractinospora alimapuensis]
MADNVSANNTVVVGVDFGTLSGRAVVVRVRDGTELGSAVHDYEHGVVTRRLPGEATELPPETCLQIPEDWRQVLRRAVPEALTRAGVTPDQVIGIGTDFTACTVLPTRIDGTPLCEIDGLTDRSHAYPKLWKHHAAQAEADMVNAAARRRAEKWLDRYGGRVSAEWQFAKALQVLREDPDVFARSDRWIEAADWIVWELSGRETRNVCSAGYKGLHQDGDWPSREYLASVAPGFEGVVDDKMRGPLSHLGQPAGRLTDRAARWTGLREGTTVAVGNVDAHVTAAAAGATRPGQLLAVMGTSTCHVMNADTLVPVPGMCGVVRDGIVPGLWGYEAGQSGVGDIFGWFVDRCLPDEYTRRARERGVSAHVLLSELASEQAVGAHGLVALDWHSGNRSVLVDHDLSGVVAGLTLATRPEEIYRALVEATAFGTRTIVESFENAGVEVRELIAAGGLIRNGFVMQVYADVLGRPISLVGSAEAPALGSAIHAAVAAGAYPDIHAAADAMGSREADVYRPDPGRVRSYDALYDIYTELHDHFGRGGSSVLHALRTIRNEAVATT